MEAITQTPPHDLSAEAVVLGSILLDPACLTKIQAMIGPDDFYRPAHSQIFKAAAYIADHPSMWGKLDLVTFRAALESRGSLCKVIDKPTDAEAMEYIDALVDGVPDSSNAMYYAKIVRDKARLRRLAGAAQETLARINSGGIDGEIDAFMSETSSRMESILRLPTERNTTPSLDVLACIEDTIGGRRKSIAWPWPALTRMAKPTAPGTVAVICGDPGSNKSFMLQEAMLFWTARQIPVAMLHLEKNRRYHLARALAQLDGNSDLTSEDWQEAHPDDTRTAFQTHQAELEAYGARVWDAQGHNATVAWVTQWIRARAAEGARIIGVDPVTAADPGQRPWEADRTLIVTCEELAAQHGCSILLVTHPRMAKGQRPTLETMAGGLSYARLTDVVLWTAVHDPPESGVVQSSLGPMQCEYSNHIALFKTRDSRGRGTHIAYHFDQATLRMHEMGCVIRDK